MMLDSESTYDLERHFQLRLPVPITVLPVLILHLIQYGTITTSWQQGCVAEINSDGGMVLCSVMKMSSKTIALRVVSASQRLAAKWIQDLSDLIQLHLTHIYNIYYEVSIPCGPICSLPINVIHEAFANGTTARCSLSHVCEIAALAPDLAVLLQQIISWNDISDQVFLGRGTFATVTKAWWTPPDSSSRWLVAVKTLAPQSQEAAKTESAEDPNFVSHFPTNFSNQQAFHHEVLNLLSIQHPNVVRFYGMCMSPSALVMEFVGGGDLYTNINDALAASNLSAFFRQVGASSGAFIQDISRWEQNRAEWIFRHRDRLPPEQAQVLESQWLAYIRDPHKNVAWLDGRLANNTRSRETNDFWPYLETHVDLAAEPYCYVQPSFDRTPLIPSLTKASQALEQWYELMSSLKPAKSAPRNPEHVFLALEARIALRNLAKQLTSTVQELSLEVNQKDEEDEEAERQKRKQYQLRKRQYQRQQRKQIRRQKQRAAAAEDRLFDEQEQEEQDDDDNQEAKDDREEIACDIGISDKVRSVSINTLLRTEESSLEDGNPLVTLREIQLCLEVVWQQLKTTKLPDWISTLPTTIERLATYHAERWIPLDWPLRLKIAVDIVQGLHCLHNMEVALFHRDLKSPNIFLTRSLRECYCTPRETIYSSALAKIGDLGLALRRVGELDQFRIHDTVFTMKGTNPIWTAPEIASGEGYSPLADIYSLGMVLWELLVQEHPFARDLQDEFLIDEMAKVKDFLLDKKQISIPPWCGSDGPAAPAYIALVRQCLDYNPNNRPKTSEIYRSLLRMIEQVAPELLPLLPSGLAWRESADANGRARTEGERAERSRTYEIVNVKTVAIPSKPSSGPGGRLDGEMRVTCVAQYGNLTWIGFENGYVGVYSGSSSSEVLLCRESDAHGHVVNDILLHPIAPHTIWSAAADGSLLVWVARPLNKPEFLEMFQMAGTFQINSKEARVRLEHGMVRVRSPRKRKDIPCHKILAVHLKQSGSKLSIVYRKTKKKDRSSKLSLSLGKTEEPERILSDWRNAILHLRESCGQSEGQLFVYPLQKERCSSGIVALASIDGNVWSATESLKLTEWGLVSSAATHGLYLTYELTQLREYQFNFGAAIMRSPSRFLASPLRISVHILWVPLGNRLAVMRLVSNKLSLVQLMEVHHSDQITRAIWVQTRHRREVWTADCSGQLSVWVPSTADSLPQLVCQLQADQGLLCLAQVSPQQVWAGTLSGSILSWDVETKQPLPLPTFKDQLICHQRAVRALAVAQTDSTKLICSGSYDRSIQLVSLRPQQKAATLPT